MIISIIKVPTTITYHYLKSIIGVRIMMFTFLILFYFSCLKCFNFNKTFNTKKFMLQHFFFQNRAFILVFKMLETVNADFLKYKKALLLKKKKKKKNDQLS